MTPAGRALILVVDDEDAVRELIADVISAYGYQAEMASDGLEALRLCAERPYDLILSDLRMPRMDGAALYEALRARLGAGMPPMVFVTGQAHAMDYGGFLASANVPVVAKPFTTEDLRRAITQALRGRA